MTQPHPNVPGMEPVGPTLPHEQAEAAAPMANVDWSLVAGLLMGKPGNWHRLYPVDKSGARRALTSRGIDVEVVGGELYAAWEPKPMYGPHPEEGEPLGENVTPLEEALADSLAAQNDDDPNPYHGTYSEE